ncbi:MAG: L-lactate dehydrogenase [Patescibacteria group bacterium]
MRRSKIVIVGTGFVGASLAFSLVQRSLLEEIVLIDVNREKAEGEAMDLQHSLPFVRPANVRVGDFRDCDDASVVVIAAGVAQKPGESRLDLAGRNIAVYRQFIPELIRGGTEAVFIVATNPLDVMTYAAAKLSGLPEGRVIGSGTVLDSSRLRFLLSEHCRVDPGNVHAYILGEHGDSEVPIWSATHIAGVSLEKYCAACGRNCGRDIRGEIFARVRDAAYEIIKRKGATYYAISLALTRIVGSVIRDEHSLLTVSCVLGGVYGLTDVALSVPAIVGRDGIERVVPIPLTPEEEEGLRRSAAVVRAVIEGAGLA